MNTKQEFLSIMAQQPQIALATAVDQLPNVRILNFYYDPEKHILYFATVKGEDKIKEMNLNPHIAFTTIPHSGNKHVKARGIAKQSKLTIFDLADCFIAKIPSYQEAIELVGSDLVLYEVSFDSAIVAKDLTTIEKITFIIILPLSLVKSSSSITFLELINFNCFPSAKVIKNDSGF